MEKRIIIIGAGISGLSAAWRLSENGIKIEVLESSPYVGGLAGTIREGRSSMDFGPHSFFSDDDEIVQSVLKLFDKGLEPHPREVKFYYKGRYMDYPLTAQSLLFQMGLYSSIQTAMSFLKSKIFFSNRPVPEEEETVEDWAIASFGEHLYRTFFKPYTEQFWKVPCSELSSRSIPTHTRMSFTNTLKSLLHRSPAKGKGSMVEREMLPTYYPVTGFGEIAEQIAAAVLKNQGQIHLGCEVTGVVELPDGRVRVRYMRNGQIEETEGDYLISTAPLPLLIKMLDHSVPGEVMASADRLDYRSLMVLGMLTHKQNVLSCGYISLRQAF